MRKPAFCISKNKDADQLRGNREADQRLCFRYTDITIHLLSKYKISSLQPSSVAVQPGLCGTWSETPKTGFLTTRLIYGSHIVPEHSNLCLIRLSSDKVQITVMILSFRTDWSGQTVQEQSDQGLYCLLFHLHHFDKIPLRFGFFV